MATDRRVWAPLTGLLGMQPAPRRWPLALRVAVSSAVPILIGWAVGDIGAGLIAVLGVFTCAYASDRPYFNRGKQSAAVAVGLAVSVTLGAWAATYSWLAVTTVSLVAVAAVWLCAALDVGPPGGYMFVLACAAGVGIASSHRPAWVLGLLVLAGGVIAWTAQMSAVLVAPRGPEKAAVAEAGEAVAAYLEHAGAAGAAMARRRAAAALSQAWVALVDYQPNSLPGATLRRLLHANHALHVLFADATNAVISGRGVSRQAAALARGIGLLEIDPGLVVNRDPDRPGLRRPPALTRLVRVLRPGAHTRRVLLRVAIAVPVAGACAVVSGLGHEYWAMAAAVLVLHQGVDRVATLRRGSERLVGTFVGLGFGAAILFAYPQGLWLVLVVVLLQFAIEMFIVRNYAIATVFITAIALTIASGGHRVNVGEFVVDRGVNTVIGCAVGILVYLIAAPRQEAHRVSESVADVILAAHAATGFLAAGEPASLAARGARRDLQESIFTLNAAEEAARNDSRWDRVVAAQLSSAVIAAEQLGYATLAACWSAEHAGPGVFGSADPVAYLAVLQRLSVSARDKTVPVIDAELPPFAAPEVQLLVEVLEEAAATP